jgi:cytochrome c biogenesis protein CcdA
MQTLFLVLASISLLDSTSMLPLAIPILIALLAGPRPYLASAAFLLGIFAVYFPAGVALTLGVEALLERVQPTLMEIAKNPSILHIALQIAIGGVMLGFGWKLASVRESHGDRGAGSGLSPAAAFGLGAGSMVVGLPGAFPYFAAVDQILRADRSAPASVLALLWYNGIFLVPLAAVPLLRILGGARADAFFARVAPWMDAWGRRVVIAVLVLLGAVGVADGVGWLFGHPLLPVPE